MPKIRFGIAPITEDPPHGENMPRVFSEIAEEARLAESVGFDSCLITEHHQQADGYLPNPLMIAAAVARETSSIKVGSCIALAPLYNPVRFAEDAALVDILSDGRLILGVGAGYAPDDLDAFGVRAQDRGSLLEDCVGFVKHSWSNQHPVSFRGTHYSYQRVNVTPKPVQRPRPEIWCGAWSGPGLRRAARLGDRLILDGLNSLSSFKSILPVYRRAAEAQGKTPRIAALRECWVAPTRAQAEVEFGPHVMTSHRFYFDAGGYSPKFDPWIQDLSSGADLTFDRVAADRFIVGSVDDCVDEIRRWHDELGLDYFVMRFRHPTGPTHDQTLEAIDRFGREVISNFTAD